MIKTPIESARAIALAGVTLIGSTGVGIPDAQAATLTSGYQTFFIKQNGQGTKTESISFNTFDTGLGTLTGVTFDLDAYLFNGEAASVSASITVDTIEISNRTGESSYDLPALDPVAAGVPLSFFEGDGITQFSVDLSVSVVATDTASYGSLCGVTPSCGFSEKGMRVTYQYETAVVPAAGTLLLLLAGGLAGLGVTGTTRRNTNGAARS